MKKTVIALLCATIILILGLFSAEKTTFAFAETGAGVYDLTYDTSSGYYSSTQGVQRKIFVSSDLYQVLTYISYTRVKTEAVGAEISNRNGTVSSNSALTKLEEDVFIYPGDLTKSATLGEKQAYYYVLPKVDTCCAFVFTVAYQAGDNLNMNYGSEVLQITNIDDHKPKVTVKNYYWSSGDYKIISALDDSTIASANSGLAGYTVYRSDIYGNNRTTYLEKEITGGRTSKTEVTVKVESGRYNYYIVAYDSVGNKSEEKLLKSFTTDSLMDSADSALKTIANHSDLWSSVLKTSLGDAYSTYCLVIDEINGEGTDEEKQQAKEDLEEALDEYYRVLATRGEGKMDGTVQFVNADYLDLIELKNVDSAVEFVKYGDKVSLTIGIGRYEYSDKRAQEKQVSGLENVTDVVQLSVSVSETGNILVESTFSEPLEIRMSVGAYKNVSFVQTIEENGEKKIVLLDKKEYANGNIAVYVPYTYGTVSVMIEREKETHLEYLYLLFLLLPIGGGIALWVIAKKNPHVFDKLKRKKKVSEEKTMNDNNQEEKVGLKKNLVINRYTVWTIPNILVFFRILCVPVYMTLTILSARPPYPYWWNFLALGIMALAASTDVFDGMIARKFTAGTKIGKYTVKHDQGTYVGQCIDPIADKTMHIGAIVALSIAGYLHWAFIILIVFREMMMIICGSALVNKVNVKSNMLGKVASAIVSLGIIACYFHKYFLMLWGVYPLDWIIVTVGLILNWSAAVGYLLYAIKERKKQKTTTQPQAVPCDGNKEEK